MMAKPDFSASLLQYVVSHDPLWKSYVDLMLKKLFLADQCSSSSMLKAFFCLIVFVGTMIHYYSKV